MKNCRNKNCSQENPQSFESFSKLCSAPDGLQYRCRTCIGASNKKCYRKNIKKRKAGSRLFTKNNPDKAKGTRLIKFWPGLYCLDALAEYNKLLEKQNGCCAICNQPETAVEKKTGKVKGLAVDHDHITGRVRSLLCTKCNTALGLVNENFDITLNLAKYIQEHHGII